MENKNGMILAIENLLKKILSNQGSGLTVDASIFELAKQNIP